jgi:hypothetical protein
MGGGDAGQVGLTIPGLGVLFAVAESGEDS